jgi:SAM-dependent methyltransferase
MPPAAEQPRCAACGASDFQPHLQVRGEPGPQGLIPTTDRFGSALADIVRCRSCGHMQLAEMPPAALLIDAYAEAASSDYLTEEAGQRVTARRVLAKIERHTNAGSLLDLGCWLGFLLAEARRRGWEVTGVEPSGFAAAYARDELELPVLTGGLIEVDLPARSFDVVFLGDVIEHIPDAGGTLERISDLLVPGGVVAMALPDAGSRLARALGARWWSVIPTHVHYFTRQSMRTMLERHGFAMLELSTAPKTFTVRYYLQRLGGYSRTVRNALVRAADACRVSDRLWTPDFRDRMLVIARRGSFVS